MRTLPDSETGPLEAHLLICRECQNRLDAVDEFVAAMRDAMKKLEVEDNGL